ncbi:eukaryotic translation initiation factor 3 subunit A [Trifolium repens]|nr:eukaryotic translation initiation factor 3 subunit A [Trifolium repens]
MIWKLTIERVGVAHILQERSLEADDLRHHLAGFAKQLNKARQMIFPPNRKQSKLELLLPCLLEVVAKDHKMMLARKSIIEKRKEKQEQQRLEMQQETEKIAEEAAEQTHLAEVSNAEQAAEQIAGKEHEEAEERRQLELFFTKQTTPEETRNEEEMAEISYNHGLFGKSKERRGCSAYQSGISTTRG